MLTCSACVFVRRQMMTPSWDFTRVLSWKILMMHGCAPMTCLGWRSTTLAKEHHSPLTSGYECPLKVWEAKRRDGREENRGVTLPSLPPSYSVLFDKHPDSWCQSQNLLVDIFEPPHQVEFLWELAEKSDAAVCPSTDLHDAGSPHYIIYRQATAERHLLAYWRHSPTWLNSTLFLLSCFSLDSAKRAVDWWWSVMILRDATLKFTHLFGSF